MFPSLLNFYVISKYVSNENNWKCPIMTQVTSQALQKVGTTARKLAEAMVQTWRDTVFQTRGNRATRKARLMTVDNCVQRTMSDDDDAECMMCHVHLLLLAVRGWLVAQATTSWGLMWAQHKPVTIQQCACGCVRRQKAHCTCYFQPFQARGNHLSTGGQGQKSSFII